MYNYMPITQIDVSIVKKEKRMNYEKQQQKVNTPNI